MARAPHAACTLYLTGLLVLTAALHIGAMRPVAPMGALQRGLSRGELAAGVPHLDPVDPMANAAILMSDLDALPHPGLHGDDGRCTAAPRGLAVMLSGRLSRVRFGARTVCQLRRLKEISNAQPGFGEVAAFVLGRRLPGGNDVDVTRVVVPPFRFTGDTLTFMPADLGPLQKDEVMIGTYHTHPGTDIEQGVLSDVDLSYMRTGYVDFHGQVGDLARPRPGLDWLFDIVEPRDGDWNVYAHDGARLWLLLRQCESQPVCPLNELRLAGSPFYLLSRYYEERDRD